MERRRKLQTLKRASSQRVAGISERPYSNHVGTHRPLSKSFSLDYRPENVQNGHLFRIDELHPVIPCLDNDQRSDSSISYKGIRRTRSRPEGPAPSLKPPRRGNQSPGGTLSGVGGTIRRCVSLLRSRSAVSHRERPVIRGRISPGECNDVALFSLLIFCFTSNFGFGPNNSFIIVFKPSLSYISFFRLSIFHYYFNIFNICIALFVFVFSIVFV